MFLPMFQGRDEGEEQKAEVELPSELPLLPLRNVVAFPYSVLPLSVGQPRSIRLLESVLEGDRLLVMAAMVDPAVDEPGPDGIHQVGTIAKVERALRGDDNEYQVVARSIARVRIAEWTELEPFLKVRVEQVEEVAANELEVEALRRELVSTSRRLIVFFPQMPDGIVDMLDRITDARLLVSLIASNIRLDIEQAQELLETADLAAEMRLLLAYMEKELEVLEIGQRIREEAQSEMEDTQREYFLRQQLKAIQKELGEGDEHASEVDEYRTKLDEAKLPEEARREADRELDRLEQMNPQSAEAGVIKTYLDWMTELPWAVFSEDNLDLPHADLVLNEDHYGLEKVKERILEFLAVRKLRLERGIEQDDEHAVAILCFVGPPGVGKTSLGRSIARALGREFTRMSLGGVRDEAEIRGHRRTYIGAMPGRFIQALKRVGTRNPVFMLDEVDKIGADWRGDPASALLEVLDPQQNHAFRDHYLDVDFDLSEIFFICTANTLSTIPAALRDRMEVIEIDGYTEYDKVRIAQGYLVPRQLRVNGLEPNEVAFSEGALKAVVRDYTREAGVRNLEREIGRALRKVATRIATCEDACEVNAEADQVREWLGKPKFRDDSHLRTELPGVATGLAWTPSGGEVLFIEARVMDDKAGLILTGQLGDVMKESARIGLSYVQGELGSLGLPQDALTDKMVHLHVPAGAIPKDGPSAGVTLVTALVSQLAERPVRGDLGMTGEVTLQGQVLPIGGIKQKVLAAHRHGLKVVVLPKANEVDLDDVPKEIRDDLSFVLVEHLDEVLAAALTLAVEFEMAADKEPAESVLGNGHGRASAVA